MDKEYKLLGRAVWFTLNGGENIGIVLMNNGYEDKAYIGKGAGFDEDADIEDILKYVTPFPVESARLMCGGSR